MAYNIGEKPGRGNYVCPNCGCRVGEITTIARREISSLGTDTISAPHNRQTTYNVKSSRVHFARLKLVTFTLVLAGLMFASGFATKTLLSGGTPLESRGANPSSDDTTLNVNTGKSGATSNAASTSPGNPEVTVWVNTESGVYHCANTRCYGNTKSGKYMSQKEAQAKGYRPAHGSVCG